jgi:putative transposase
VGGKIKFYPSAKLKEYFKKCFGIYRYFYNKTAKYHNSHYDDKLKEISELKNNGTCCYFNGTYCKKSICDDEIYFCDKHKGQTLKFGTNTSFIDARNKLLTPNKLLKEDEKWQSEVPYDLRQYAVKDACDALKTCLTNKTKKNIKNFKLGYKDKKNINQMFKITNDFIKLDKQTMFGYDFVMRDKMKKWINKKIKNLNSKVTIKKEGEAYYICGNFDVDYKIPQTRVMNSVSIDPGVRTFLTLYSSDGLVGKIGDGTIEKLSSIGEKIDKMTSIISKKERTSKTRRNMKKRCGVLRTKIHNIVMDLHWKAINFLCLNFRTIIIPNFETSKKVRKTVKCVRKITNDTVRNMLSLSHGKFLERLEYYAVKSDTQLIITDEEYTSKTCGKCGKLDKNLGGKKMYACDKCGYKCDRDINGARNINIKLLASCENKGLDSSPKNVISMKSHKKSGADYDA